MNYHWNRELKAYLRKKNRFDSLVLLLVLFIMIWSMALFSVENNLKKMYAGINSESPDQTQNSLDALVQQHSFVNEKKMKEHFQNLKPLRATSIRMEDNSIYLRYQGYEVSELEDEISFLKEKYRSVVVERVDQNPKEKWVSIEVKI